MGRLWAIKELDAGVVLAVLSALVARDYMRTLPAGRPPGLSLADEQPPIKASRYSMMVGLCYLAAAIAGLVIAIDGIRRL